MKKIFLVRHAKSSWSNDSLQDIDRPLNDRGYKNAHEMADFLLRSGYRADIFLSSSAIRAISTALIFSRAGLIDETKIQIHPSLYEGNPETYLKVINGQSDNLSSLFLFAHNPTISEVWNLMVKGRLNEMTTCNVARIEYPVESWQQIAFGNGKNAGFYKPGMLGAM